MIKREPMLCFVVAKRRILSRNRIKIETSKEEPLALKIEAEAFFSLSFDNDSFAIYTVHYIPYIIPTMESKRCNFLHRQSSDKGFSRRKRDALPHFALVNRIHPRAFGTIEFRSEFRQIRERSYHSVFRWTMSVFLDLKGYRLGHYGGTPNLRTNVIIPFTFAVR